MEDRIKPWLQPHLDRGLPDFVGYGRHTPSELHSTPTDLWVLPKSFIRSIRCVASGSSF